MPKRVVCLIPALPDVCYAIRAQQNELKDVAVTESWRSDIV